MQAAWRQRGGERAAKFLSTHGGSDSLASISSLSILTVFVNIWYTVSGGQLAGLVGLASWPGSVSTQLARFWTWVAGLAAGRLVVKLAAFWL
jgi:hypothetical protein